MMILWMLVVLGVVVYAMNPEERARALVLARRGASQAKNAFDERRLAHDPFRDALQARTRWPIVTLALVIVNVWVFAGMLVGAGAIGAPDTLVRWGASLGPRTTNGEWWRLVTATCVHAGMLSLLIDVAALGQVGVILERLFGHVAFAAVYLAAGVLAGLVSLSAHPIAVSAGAAGAIFGLYGLLLAIVAIDGVKICRAALQRRRGITSLLQDGDSNEAAEPPAAVIPWTALKRLAPTAGVFLLYSLLFGGDDRTAGLIALASGAACGGVLAIGAAERKPQLRRIAGVAAGAALIAVALAVPLRGVADVRPEIHRLIEQEARTASRYQAAVDQFKLGAIDADALARVIDREILPVLQTAGTRLNEITGVPPQHRPLVADAKAYLALRTASWRLRSRALHRSSMRTLRAADEKAHVAVGAFEKLTGSSLTRSSATASPFARE